ncbi:unnamed protein product, partial [Discosporangium mesarthrocarpum]
MATSNFRRKIDHWRDKLLSELIVSLGFPVWSEEHMVALEFCTNSVRGHDYPDTDARKVEEMVCGFAEKIMLCGRQSGAKRFVRLTSSICGKEFHPEGFPRRPSSAFGLRDRLTNPYANLSLLFLLSSSVRFGFETAGKPGQEGMEEASHTLEAEGLGSLGQEGRGQGAANGVSGTDWSPLTGEGGRREHGVGPVDTDEVDDAQREWAQEFNCGRDDMSDWSSNDGCRTPDDEGTCQGEDTKVKQAENKVPPPVGGDVFSMAAEVPLQPAPAPRPSRTTVADHPVVPRRSFHHAFGLTSQGVEARQGWDRGGMVWPYLRPCQLLEASQLTPLETPLGGSDRDLEGAGRVGVLQGLRAPGWPRGIPEAEVLRAALLMLRGLEGSIFQRQSWGRGSAATGFMAGPSGTPGGARSGLQGDGKESLLGNNPEARRFVLTPGATRSLAVWTLSPMALRGQLEGLLRLGDTAEYLRRFVEDVRLSGTATGKAAVAVFAEKA